MLTPALIRGARAMLQMSQAELAEKSGISKTGLANIELGNADARASTLTAIQAALEAAGAEFIGEGAGGLGVRLRPQGGDWVTHRLLNPLTPAGMPDSELIEALDRPIKWIVRNGTALNSAGTLRAALRLVTGANASIESPGFISVRSDQVRALLECLDVQQKIEGR